MGMCTEIRSDEIAIKAMNNIVGSVIFQ